MQGAFDFYRDLPARPERPERLFFALVPDGETSVRVARFSECFIRDHRLEGTRLKRECLHVSLHHVGDYRRLRPKFVYAATQAARTVAMRRFEMIFRFVRSFDGFPARDGRPRNRPLVLLGEGGDVRALHKSLGAAMEKTGLKAAAHFMPHMTVFYGLQPVPVQTIAPIRFAVEDFALIHSALHLTRHTVVERWRLDGAATPESPGG